jgi:hypothetical protein
MSVRVPRAIALLTLALLVVLAPLAGSPAAGAQAVADTTPPETTINFGPEGSTSATRPVFGYESDDPYAYFECSLDSGPFEFCGPATYESLEGKKGKLADGPHTFSVRAVNEAEVADPTPAVASFIVDTSWPAATIVTRPGPFTHDTTPTFRIEVSGESTFGCRIVGDGVRIKVPSCDGPTSFTSPRPLPEGTYELVVRAVDAAGNETEDQVQFTVRTKPGPPPPTPDPFRGSTLYTGRGEKGRGIKSISLRVKGHKLIEARVVVIEACLGQPWTARKWHRYHKRQVLEMASPRWPLRVDGRGDIRKHRSALWQSSDEYEDFVGKVTPASIVGTVALSSGENQGPEGESYRCHTGPFPGPEKELKFHAWRR